MIIKGKTKNANLISSVKTMRLIISIKYLISKNKIKVTGAFCGPVTFLSIGIAELVTGDRCFDDRPCNLEL